MGLRGKGTQLLASQPIIRLLMMPNMCELSLFCIQNYRVTTMNASHKYKKLRTINSLETDCTLDDNLDRSIKIKVFSPKEETGSGKLDLVPEEMTQMKDLASSRSALGKNLMNVPQLSRKQPEISLLEASNTTEQVQGDRIRISGKSMHRGSDCFDDSMNFREMIITKGSKNLASDGQLTGLGLIKNIISQQKGRKQSNRRQEGCFRLNFKSFQSEEEMMKSSLVESEVNFDEEAMERPFEGQTEKTIPVIYQNEERLKQILPRMKLSSKYESLQSFKSEKQLKKNRSNSRLKLRDYIYMVEASSKRQFYKHVKIEHPKPTPTFSQQTSPSLRKVEGHIDDMMNYNPRKDCVKSKYNVTNKMMFDILKEDIFTQISMAKSTISSVRQELEEVESSLEPSNEELLILYNIRREMKEEINRKLQSTLQSLRTQKKAKDIITSKRSHNA